jgi:hypothetical protein
LKIENAGLSNPRPLRDFPHKGKKRGRTFLEGRGNTVASATASFLPMTEKPLNPLKGTSAYIGKAPFRGLGVDINVISPCLNFLSALAVTTVSDTTVFLSPPLEGLGEASPPCILAFHHS